MTNTKSTKRALLASVMALLLCFSMLLSTTFAWFTDSVTSGNNIIQSGNLDIELEYAVFNDDGTFKEWADVKDASDILTNTLWEPGVTEVAYLRIANAGSLVLKYQFGINILNEIEGKNQKNETFKLSDYIMFGVVEEVNGETEAYAKTDAGRAEAIADVTDAKKISAGYTKASTMNPNDELYLALVVYMPTDIGNVANHNGIDVPQIDLGINVLATQMTAEDDSFGNDYDSSAPIVNAPENVPEDGNSLVLNSSVESNITVIVPSGVLDNISDNVTGMSIAASAPIVDVANKTVKFETIELVDQDGNEIDLSNSTAKVTVTLPADDAFDDGDEVEIYHDGTFVTFATVANGNISYEVSHFCEVEVKVAEEVKLEVVDNSLTINTVKEFVAFASSVNAGNTYAGKTVVLGADIDLAGVTWTPIGNSSNNFKGIFNGNGKVIKNLTVLMAGKSNVGLFGDTRDGEIKNVTVENAIVAGRLNVGVVAGNPYTSKYTNITVKGHVEVDGMAYVGAVGGKNAYANWDTITVEVDETSYVKANSVENGTAYRTYVGGVVGFNGEGTHTFSNITSNIDVFGSTCDVGGAFGIAHYGNKFENITVTGNVTITNAAEAADAEEMGGIAGVWHNQDGTSVTFTSCKFTGKLSANVDAYLSDNTIVGTAYNATGKGQLIIDGKKTVVVNNLTDMQKAIDDGATFIDAKGTNLGDFNYSVKFTDGVVIKNAKFTYFYGGNVTGTATFENCEFIADSSYCANFDSGNGNIVFNNCTFDGWSSFGTAITNVEMNNCTFLKNYNYGVLRFYQTAQLNNCTFSENFEGVDTNMTGYKVELDNCTGIDGKIYNNGDNKGIWVVDGNDISDEVTSW